MLRIMTQAVNNEAFHIHSLTFLVCSPLLNAPENIESEPTRECDMDIANPDDTIPEFRGRAVH